MPASSSVRPGPRRRLASDVRIDFLVAAPAGPLADLISESLAHLIQGDTEAVEKLVSQFTEASVSDTTPGWDGGFGARVHPPRLKPPPADGSAPPRAPWIKNS